MSFFSTAGETPASRPPGTEQAAVAALAVKAAELPARGTAPSDSMPTSGSPIAATGRGFSVHGWLWWMCYLLAWVVTLTLCIVAGLHIFYHDGTYFLAWINAFTRYVYLPAYPCLVWAAWQRRWRLAFAGLAIVACHFVWMAPDFVRDRRFDLPAEPAAKKQFQNRLGKGGQAHFAPKTPQNEPVPGSFETAAKAVAESPTVRIFFANVLQTNREFDAMLQEIATANPDAVVVAEWGWGWNKAFKQSPLSASYPHGTSAKQPHFGMVNIFSKLPLNSEMQNWVAGRLVRTADIRLGAQTLRLVALHAPRPLYAPTYDYDGYWNQLMPLLKTETGPLLVVGDFNATEHSLVYKRLKAAGLRSAHDDRGRGYATTWPNGAYWLPPIRIDQAFLSPEVECLGIAEGRGRGSDHKPLIIDVQVRKGVPRPVPALAAGVDR